MIKHTNYIYQYDNFVSDSQVDEIYSVCKSRMTGKNLLDGERNNSRKNDAYYFALFDEDNEVNYIHKLCANIGYRAFNQYYNDCPLTKYNIMHEYGLLSNFVYRVYNKADHYSWHVDKSHTDIQLKVSFLLYLNDDFEGGNTLFLNDRLKVRPKKGTVLMFPCGPYFIHKSTQVLSGQKHVIWNCFGQRALPTV